MFLCPCAGVETAALLTKLGRCSHSIWRRHFLNGWELRRHVRHRVLETLSVSSVAVPNPRLYSVTRSNRHAFVGKVWHVTKRRPAIPAERPEQARVLACLRRHHLP